MPSNKSHVVCGNVYDFCMYRYNNHIQLCGECKRQSVASLAVVAAATAVAAAGILPWTYISCAQQEQMVSGCISCNMWRSVLQGCLCVVDSSKATS
jgi:hypothetical protein